MRQIREIIVHCSATREGQDIKASTIRTWHVRDRGFRDIGYHYVIDLDGTVEKGRPVAQIGAHCTGHNAYSIGVCYIGGVDNNLKPKDTRTPAQKAALLSLLTELKRKYPRATIHGHREFANKACPSFDAKAEYKSL